MPRKTQGLCRNIFIASQCCRRRRRRLLKLPSIYENNLALQQIQFS